jgi:hypothetical protein
MELGGLSRYAQEELAPQVGLEPTMQRPHAFCDMASSLFKSCDSSQTAAARELFYSQAAATATPFPVLEGQL